MKTNPRQIKPETKKKKFDKEISENLLSISLKTNKLQQILFVFLPQKY